MVKKMYAITIVGVDQPELYTTRIFTSKNKVKKYLIEHQFTLIQDDIYVNVYGLVVKIGVVEIKQLELEF